MNVPEVGLISLKFDNQDKTGENSGFLSIYWAQNPGMSIGSFKT